MLYANLPSLFYSYEDERSVSYKNDLYKYHENDTLRIAIEKDVAGIFQYNDGYYGYLHAIFREFALYNGKILHIELCQSQRQLIKLINSDSVAFGVTISSKDGINSETKSYLQLDINDSTQYVLLGNVNNKIINKLPLQEILDSAKVIYKRGSKEVDLLSERSLDYLRDSSSARFLTTRDYVSLIRNGEYDFLICKEEEAFFYYYNYRNIKKIGQLDQWVYSTVITNKRNRILAKEFNKWFHEFSKGELYSKIVDYYHNDAYIKNFIEDGFLNLIGAISHFDDIFRTKAQSTPFNWRFLAAIGYTESKFSTFERSSRGAVGIMQIMPASARQWGIESDDELRQPKVNISIAVKLLLANMKLLKMDSELSRDDIGILLACYNAGYGHVSDAIRLAKRDGKDHKSWKVIARYLSLKRNPNYYTLNSVKYGRFNSDTTERFVNDVMVKYDEYLKMSHLK